MVVSYKKLWKLLIDRDLKKISNRYPESVLPQLPNWAEMKMSIWKL